MKASSKPSNAVPPGSSSLSVYVIIALVCGSVLLIGVLYKGKTIGTRLWRTDDDPGPGQRQTPIGQEMRYKNLFYHFSLMCHNVFFSFKIFLKNTIQYFFPVRNRNKEICLFVILSCCASNTTLMKSLLWYGKSRFKADCSVLL